MADENHTDLGTYDKQLANQQEQFLQLLESVGLPSKDIFVPVKERAVVFQNAHALLDKIGDESRSHAAYISKFFAAVAGGLFDAALNYIWDETVLHLRMRIEAYDLEYFYEIAASEDKRKDLKTIEDISKLTDDELLRGSLKIELISEIGFRNIDLVRYMRNNASAAHPNQTGISGLKLVSMAEDCLREVISTPIPPAAIAVQQLLANVRDGSISEADAKQVAAHFPDMGPERTQKLAKGLFGIFYKRDTPEQVRQNIRYLAPLLWPFIDEETRKYFGIRHAFFSANNHSAERTYAREFLTVVDGLGYITDQQRAVEVLSIVDELENAHDGLNNFYNEVLPARRLQSILGNPSKVPPGAEKKYIDTLVNVFLSNGYGIAFSANEIYSELLSGLTPRQAIYAVALVFDEGISSKLRIDLCAKKYIEMVDSLSPKISTHAAKQLVTEVKSGKQPLPDIRANKMLKALADTALEEIKVG
jgi:hypothetical protein